MQNGCRKEFSPLKSVNNSSECEKTYKQKVMMYYSEFTLNLIEEVKKRQILYNTKYEKRPKPEKEEAWREIAECLESTPEKCKKHWKNIRDRFVKVMHLRDKHFSNKGSELDAPQYIYFDKMVFMREFSIKKVAPRRGSLNDVTISDISPEPLVYEEDKDSEGVSLLDYTDQFLDLVKDYPLLYDENSELRKYRSKTAWKEIADSLSGKFTVGHLRNYWVTLMKKYKLYLEHPHAYLTTIENEVIFENLSFTNAASRVKEETDNSSYVILEDEETDDSKDLLEQFKEDSLMLCEVEDSVLASPGHEESIEHCEIEDQPDDEATEKYDEESEPKPKRVRINTAEASSVGTFQYFEHVNDILSPSPSMSKKENESSLVTLPAASQSNCIQKQSSLNLPFFETLAPTMDSLPLSAQLKLRAKFMNLLAEEVGKMEELKSIEKES